MEQIQCVLGKEPACPCSNCVRGFMPDAQLRIYEREKQSIKLHASYTPEYVLSFNNSEDEYNHRMKRYRS